jgi:DnaK suppressor protein
MVVVLTPSQRNGSAGGSPTVAFTNQRRYRRAAVGRGPKSIERHRERLLAMRAEILSQGNVAIEPSRTDPTAVGGDEDEQALREMNQVIASRRNRVRTVDLGRIQAALRRLEESPDDFGSCIECGEPIGKRLELLPYVELCVECQQARDGSPKGPNRRHLRDFR